MGQLDIGPSNRLVPQPGKTMRIELERDHSVPVYRQIAQKLRSMIESGTLPAGTRLPPSRTLARDLKVNRATVTAAYDALGTLGYVEARVGRGTFVGAEAARGRSSGLPPATAVADPAQPDPLPREGTAADISGVPWSAPYSRGMEQLMGFPTREPLTVDHPEAVDFAALFPDESFFPVATFRRLMADVLARRGRELLQYSAPEGDPELRTFLAGELNRAGMQVTADHIVIVNGAQQGLDLLLRAFVDPGDPVVVESPTYWSLLPALGFYRADVIEVPMTPQGLDLDVLSAVVAERRPKLIYTMPNFQNPTGLTMNLETRQGLADIARRHSIPVVEDDYEKDLRLLGNGLPGLKAIAPEALIMHLGTFSKGLFPGLRLGWIAAPPAVLERLLLAKRYADLHTSSLAQAVIAAFCRGGHYEKHLKKLHRIYRQRRTSLLAALERHFPADATWTRPDGGYALWVTLPPAMRVTDLLAESRRQGVVFTPGPYFFHRAEGENCFRLSIARTDRPEIERGIEVLGRLIKRQLRAGPGPDGQARRAAARSLPHL